MRTKYTKEKLQEVVSSSLSISQCLRKLNMAIAGGNYRTLNEKFLEWEIDISHFTGQGWNVGSRYRQVNPTKPLSEILINGSKYQSHKLRLRLLKEGLKEHKCDICNRRTWMSNPIPLELHHIDGDKYNNLLENLQVICPNCHAQTDNYRAKNMGSFKKKLLNSNSSNSGKA